MISWIFGIKTQFPVIFIQLNLTSGSEPYSFPLGCWDKAIPRLLIAACQSIILFLGFWRVLIICMWPHNSPHPPNHTNKDCCHDYMSRWRGVWIGCLLVSIMQWGEAACSPSLHRCFSLLSQAKQQKRVPSWVIVLNEPGCNCAKISFHRHQLHVKWRGSICDSRDTLDCFVLTGQFSGISVCLL